MKGLFSKVQGGAAGKAGEGKAAVPHGDDLPAADITLPRKHDKRRSSHVQRHASNGAQVKELPLLSETPMLKRESLFRQKLQLCCTIFDFEDADSDMRGKEIKRETLVELTEYVNTQSGQKIFSEALMPDIVQMVRANLLRALPPPSGDCDVEEAEPIMEAAWPHLQVVYEFFLRFIVSSEVNGKVSKRFVDQAFIRRWIELFDAEDPRERDYVKTILHRMYGKMMSHRSFIRKTISQVFFTFIYETGRHNGIAELLEILGSIINGFAVPLKSEHVQFLERALIPLHKPHNLAAHHPQLSYCTSQYVEKDPDTLAMIVNGLVKIWPWTDAGKQVLFLNELEETLELCRVEQLLPIHDSFFRLVAQCLRSTHFQVVERVLYFWNSEHMCVTIFSPDYAARLLPHVFGPLTSLSSHWNHSVQQLSESILKMYKEMDSVLFDKCARENNELRKREEADREAALFKWKQMMDSAKTAGLDVDILVA